MGRINLVDVMMAAPACCKLCGSVHKAPVVDMGYSEEFYGAVYYCVECASEIARIIGFEKPSDGVVLQNKLLTQELKEALPYKEKYTSLIKVLSEHVSDSIARDALSHPTFVTHPKPVQLDEAHSASNEHAGLDSRSAEEPVSELIEPSASNDSARLPEAGSNKPKPQRVRI